VSRKINTAPVAVTTDGALVVNAAGFEASPNVSKLIARAMNGDAEIFIGVVVSGKERKLMMTRLDGAAAEAVAMVIGRRAKCQRR